MLILFLQDYSKSISHNPNMDGQLYILLTLNVECYIVLIVYNVCWVRQKKTYIVIRISLPKGYIQNFSPIFGVQKSDFPSNVRLMK